LKIEKSIQAGTEQRELVAMVDGLRKKKSTGSVTKGGFEGLRLPEIDILGMKFGDPLAEIWTHDI